MSDIYGKGQNPTCRSSCNKFAKIVLAPGVEAHFKIYRGKGEVRPEGVSTTAYPIHALLEPPQFHHRAISYSQTIGIHHYNL